MIFEKIETKHLKESITANILCGFGLIAIIVGVLAVFASYALIGLSSVASGFICLGLGCLINDQRKMLQAQIFTQHSLWCAVKQMQEDQFK